VSVRRKFLPALLLLIFGCLPAAATVHSVPKDRASLRDRDWLPHVISKIVPLEWWSFASSPADLRREDYNTDFRYELAKQDTWELPRFCFSLFRPKAQIMSLLYAAVDEYKGDVIWAMHDDCIGAMPGKPTFYTSITTPEQRRKCEEELARNPPHADPEFVKRAMSDAPTFAAYLEQRLGLAGKTSLDFDPQWLTREGLAASRPRFEDYWEPGDRSVFLARDPEEYSKTSKPTSPVDRDLAMGIGMFEEDSLLVELDTEPNQRGAMSGVSLPSYPLLSRLGDIADVALYEPDEVNALLAEIAQAQAQVKAPPSIRCLDNLVRIARWAQKLKVGIYFGEQ
jgi:hypothetical protein